MIKGRLTPPICLFHVATQAEQDQYILIEWSVHLVLLKVITTQVYN